MLLKLALSVRARHPGLGSMLLLSRGRSLWRLDGRFKRQGCGTVRGRERGGAFVSYPIQLGGRVSASGQVRMNAVAGPRIAHGTGRFSRFRGSGTWSGNGPSGLCSGVWSAIRS
jgi:hypothetical protein